MGMTILQAQQRLHEKWMELTKDGTDEEMMQSLCIADTVLGNYEESLKADMVAVLDAIRSEIRLEKLGYPPSAGYYQAIVKVLQIIDKYKTEFEEEDGDDN